MYTLELDICCGDIHGESEIIVGESWTCQSGNKILAGLPWVRRKPAPRSGAAPTSPSFPAQFDYRPSVPTGLSIKNIKNSSRERKK